MKLLIVEQDATQLELYTLSLEDEFDIITVSTMDEALEVINKQSIGIVLSNWHVGKHTAAAFCQANTESKTKPPVVMVMSSISDDDTMREAFKAGVSHYFIKPYNVISFTETIVNAKHQIMTLAQMEKDNERTRETTKTALSQAAIYGTGMEIVSSLNQCDSAASMAKKVLNTLRLNGVHCALQFRSEGEVETIDTDLTPCDDITLKVFKVLHDQGRIYRFGRRLMLNDTCVSLLVKNIAKDDPVLYDAILDMGAKLVPAIEARFKSLQQQQTMINLNTDVNDVIDKVQVCFRRLNAEKRQIIQGVSSQIRSSFHELEMTEAQESFFMALIEKELESREDDQDLIKIDALLTAISEQLKVHVTEFSTTEEEEEYLDVEFF
ncbi:response regulator [Alteromonas gracilis]|uniref:response regulator n=1 Tax=Alteromonas gracilis TaxID=1479524 RepID=UPI00373672A1